MGLYPCWSRAATQEVRLVSHASLSLSTIASFYVIMVEPSIVIIAEVCLSLCRPPASSIHSVDADRGNGHRRACCLALGAPLLASPFDILRVLDDFLRSLIILYYLCKDPDIHQCTCKQRFFFLIATTRDIIMRADD